MDWVEKAEEEELSTTPPWGTTPPSTNIGKVRRNLRDLSCLLLCSLRLKALAQNVHLYLRSGVGFCAVLLDEAATCAVAAAGMAGTNRNLVGVDQRAREKRAKPADTGARLTMGWICINGIPSIMPLGVFQREGTGEMSVGELSDFGLGC